MTATESDRLIVSTPSDLEIVMTRAFNAPRQLVFDAWTKPEILVRWFGQSPEASETGLFKGSTMPGCEVDLRPGGAWRFLLRGPDGSEMGMAGVYREVVPPERIVSTETFDAPYFEVMGGETLNTMTFEEHDGKTTMTITTLYKSREERDAVLQTGMEEGAGEGFDRLAELLPTLQ